LPPVRWDVDARALYSHPASGAGGSHGLYLGRYPDRELAGRRELGIPVNPDEPIEPAEDGCPAGWARSPFVESLDPYVRRRVGEGHRVPNPFFDSAPWQVQRAVLYLEIEQERWAAYRAEVDHQRWLQQQKRSKAKHGSR
jgi:hypothetical protein